MATYISIANLQKYDSLLKEYIADGWYDKSEIDGIVDVIEAREANFIDRSVNDLVNYYTKSQTYTQAEVNQLISVIPQFSIQVVNELPTHDISTTTIYLLRNEEQTGSNLYTEYIYVDNHWEELGSQEINLDNYYTKEEVNDLIPTNVSTLENDAGYISNDDIGNYAVTGIKGESELVYQKGNLTLNKRMVGLSLVENKSPRQIISEMTGNDVNSALGYIPVNPADEDIEFEDKLSVGRLIVGDINPDATFGYNSVSMGTFNTARGTNSVAQGSSTVCDADWSHTEGVSTYIAQSSPGGLPQMVMGAHAEGYYTEAKYSYQHVEGKYNDNKSGTLLEVGNGTATNNRSNAFEIYSDGKFSQDNGTTKFKFTRYNNEDGYYDASGTFHAFGSGGGGSSTLSGLSDVSISSVSNGQLLAYDNISSKWVNANPVDISGKADKVSSATSGNFAGLDSNGNLTDSGSKASDFLTQHQDISGKADKVSSATNGNFAGLDSNGNLTDSGSKASDFKSASAHDSWSEVTSKPFSSIGNGLQVTNNTLKTDIQILSENTSEGSYTYCSDLLFVGNDQYEIYGSYYIETSTKSTAAGVDTFTFTDTRIKTYSVIDVYCNKWGVSPETVTVSNGSCVVKFSSSDLVTSVRIYIKY